VDPAVSEPPVGLEMIAGNENAMAPQSTKVVAAAARRAIGWFLVGVGLRLAVPRPRSAATR
jgi:hypothetical protein